MLGAGPERATGMASRAPSSVANGPRASGRPSSFVCSASKSIQPLEDCSTVNRPSLVRYVPAFSRFSASTLPSLGCAFAFAFGTARSLAEGPHEGVDGGAGWPHDPPMPDEFGRDDELDQREAARIRRRDQDGDAAGRDLMRPGMGKVFKQIQDAQAKAAKPGKKPGRARRERA